MSFIEIETTWDRKRKRTFIPRDFIRKVDETDDGHAQVFLKDGTEELVPQSRAHQVFEKLNAEI